MGRGIYNGYGATAAETEDNRAATMIKAFLLAGLAAAVTVSCCNEAVTQSYPVRPISIVVPFPPGGPTDALTRIMAERMTTALGQTIVVENVTGAAGTIGTGRVARAAPDGYTLVMGNLSTHVVNGAVYALAYDLVKDFEPIAVVASNPQLIVGRSNLPAGNLVELIAWLKANGEKVSAGTAGAGSPAHIGGAFFQVATGTRFQFVPYRGAAPIMQDLIGGQIDITFAQTANALPQVRDSKIRAYAVTARKRLARAPDIPTADQAGLPSFEVSIWHGLWAPKGTPADIIAKLDAAVVATLADGKIGRQFADLGIEIPPREQQTPEGLSAYHMAEIAKWTPIIRATNIKPE
jgi:tripartite-type tricarboxylate transporter receptor subunit TctC